MKHQVKSKLFVVLSFFAAIALATGIFFMPKTNALAQVDTTAGFYVEDGAAVRVQENSNGIRWTGHMSKDYYNQISEDGTKTVEFGLAIAPVKNGDTLGKENLYAYDGDSSVFASKDSLTFTVAIYYDELLTAENVSADNVYTAYTTTLQARPYYKVDGGETQYGEYFDTGRSIQGIALYYLINVDSLETDGFFTDKPYTKGEFVTLLKGYVNYGKTNAGTIEVKSDVLANAGYYSYYDAANGKTAPALTVSGVELSATDKLYAGAKDITYALNTSTGALDMSKVIIENVTPGTVANLWLLKTDGSVYNVPYTYATLAIDELDDLSYFQVKQARKETQENDIVKFADGDVEFNGYYVLLNDIDANQSVHTFEYVSTTSSVLGLGITNAVRLIASNKGLTGTFDGNGHTISNLRVENGGLFGWINGGTVKNVAFTGWYYTQEEGKTDNLARGASDCTGMIAYALCNGGVMDNVYFHTKQLAMNDSQQGSILFNYAGEDCSISNSYIYHENMGQWDWGHYTNNLGGNGLIGNINDISNLFKNTVILSALETRVSSYQNAEATRVYLGTDENGDAIIQKARIITWDAKIVDGVEMDGTSTKFYTNQTDYKSYNDYGDTEGAYICDAEGNKLSDITYTYEMLNGVKRYNSLAALQADAINNTEFFANFNADVWEIINGVPTFAYTLTEANVSVYAGDEQVTDSILLTEDTSKQITFKNNGSAVQGKVKLAVVSGTSVSVNGNVLVAKSNVTLDENSTYATSVITATYKNITKTITVKVSKPITEIETSYVYSAVTGEFFNADMSEIFSLTDILETETLSVISATDAIGNELTVSDSNVITGLTTRGDAVTETSIIINTANGSYSIPVNAYTLVINEATDLAHFKMSGGSSDNWDWSKVTGYTFDGYYILANDIDCADYTHNLRNSAIGAFASMSMSSVRNMLSQSSNKGFCGTFDGNGYSIYHFTSNAKDSLLGILNGGTVKNVNIQMNKIDKQVSGALFSWVINNAKVENVRVSNVGTSSMPISEWGAWLFMIEADTTATFKNIVIEHLWSGNAYTGHGNGPIMKSNSWSQFTNFILISTNWSGLEKDSGSTLNYKKQCTVCSGTGLVEGEVCTEDGCEDGWISKASSAELCKITKDAKYVDGVEREATDNKYFIVGQFGEVQLTLKDTLTLADGSTSYSITLLENCRRYTSFGAIMNDNTAELKEMFAQFDSDIWVFNANRPTFKKSSVK